MTEDPSTPPQDAGVGRVEALWTKRVRRGPMDPADRIRLVLEVFDRIRAELPTADPGMRRANVMVSGIRLEGTRDRILRLGGVRLHVRGETRPCERMDAQCDGLRLALDPHWNGGVFAVVLDDGEVGIGDEVRWDGAVGGP